MQQLIYQIGGYNFAGVNQDCRPPSRPLQLHCRRPHLSLLAVAYPPRSRHDLHLRSSQPSTIGLRSSPSSIGSTASSLYAGSPPTSAPHSKQQPPEKMVTDDAPFPTEKVEAEKPISPPLSNSPATSTKKKGAASSLLSPPMANPHTAFASPELDHPAAFFGGCVPTDVCEANPPNISEAAHHTPASSLPVEEEEEEEEEEDTAKAPTQVTGKICSTAATPMSMVIPVVTHPAPATAHASSSILPKRKEHNKEYLKRKKESVGSKDGLRFLVGGLSRLKCYVSTPIIILLNYTQSCFLNYEMEPCNTLLWFAIIKDKRIIGWLISRKSPDGAK